MPLSLHLVAFGRNGELVSVASVRPAINANQASYAHGAMSEWWRVLPVGFEQGFTIVKRPGGHGELTLALTASRQDAGLSASHAQAGAPGDKSTQDTLAWGRLRYGDLVVTDARGQVIPATLKTNGDRILIAVNDARAVYPLTVDPLVWLEQKVTASDGAANDGFGNSVALDGTTALVSAPFANVSGNIEQGAAYVFAESGGIWMQTQKLTASDGAALNEFGFSGALDGTTALVGAPLAVVNGNASQGAVYVFAESGGNWTQTQKLTSSDGAALDGFGGSVALSGTIAIVGAPGATVNGINFRGAAYVFSDSGGSWAQTAKLTASDGANLDFFGTSVALAGATVLVGADGATVNGNFEQGAAYVFNEILEGTWTQTQKLTASDGAAHDEFGGSVALDGTTALVGADQLFSGGPGAAYVFSEFIIGIWTQTQKLTASDGAVGDQFGKSVALDGTTALAGAYCATYEPFFQECGPGAAYFYGESDLGLAVSAPATVGPGQDFVSQTIATNNASAASPAVTATVAVPAAASFISASATQGTCSEDSGVVTCDFGQVNGNAGTAAADVTFKATGNVGDTIDNTASIAKATPALTASAATVIQATDNPPVAENGTLTTTENTAASGTLVASDPDGDPLTYVIDALPANGTVTLNDASTGAYTYTPNNGYVGSDSFTFHANDGTLDSNEATISITVNPAPTGCPAGYAEYDGTLAPRAGAISPPYAALAGEENAILTAPAGFHLFAVLKMSGQQRHIYRVPGHELHRWGPFGKYQWVVMAGADGGDYTLCIQHP